MDRAQPSPGQSRSLVTEALRVLVRLALLTTVIVIVFPRLPGVRFTGSALAAVVVAAPHALFFWLGHASVSMTSTDTDVRGDTGRAPDAIAPSPKRKRTVTKSKSLERLTARRWGWAGRGGRVDRRIPDRP